jgi:hypothetical protein
MLSGVSTRDTKMRESRSAMSLLDPDRLQAIAEDLRVVERLSWLARSSAAGSLKISLTARA